MVYLFGFSNFSPFQKTTFFGNFQFDLESQSKTMKCYPGWENKTDLFAKYFLPSSKKLVQET